MRLQRLALSCALSTLGSTAALAQIGAVWTTPTTGTLGASSFTVTGFVNPRLNPFNLTTSSFSGAPLSSAEISAEIACSSSWTIQFSPPVQDLRVYCIFWRGYNGQAGPTGAAGPSDYAFNHTPTVLSGLVNATFTAATMTCPDGFFHNGILEFPGAISTLTCTTTATQGHFHAMQLGGEVPGPFGASYCTPAVPNSTGASGLIAGAGSTSVAANDVTLTASSLPLNAFGFFLTSRTQGNVPQPGGSQGVLCLGGSIGRYVGPGQIKNSGATGSFSLVLNLAATPTPTGPVAVVAGETWSFQAWHRDSVGGAATSNFTHGLSVQFN